MDEDINVVVVVLPIYVFQVIWCAGVYQVIFNRILKGIKTVQTHFYSN